MRMRRALDDPDHAGAVARRRAFFQRWKLFDRQVGDEEALEGVEADAQADGEFALCQGIGQLTLIPAYKEILLDELPKVALSFDIPEKRPDGLARAGSPRVEKSDLTLPLGIQEVVQRAQLVGFGQVGIVPEAAGAGVGDERIEEAFRFDVILPDVSSPPIFLFPYLGQNQIGLQRLDHPILDKRLIGARSADEGVEVFNSGFVFRGDPAGVLRTSCYQQLHIDAEFRLEDYL